jgi:hypothetical protein
LREKKLPIDVLAVGIASAIFCVLLPGWGLKQLFISRGMSFRTDQVSSWLSSFALGVHVNAVIFIVCWTLVDPAHPIRLAAVIIAVHMALGGGGLLVSRRLPRVGFPIQVALIVGLILGVFAALRFPSTLDSIQILQVQHYLLGWKGGHLLESGALAGVKALMFGGLDIPIQSGFGGISLVPSLILWMLPVATVAAANKVLLLCLASVVALYVARQFDLKFKILAAALVLANLILSQFGLYGLFFFGKDSAFSILMATASIAALTQSDDESNEPGLYMSAALLLGAVAAPYLMIFWTLYFVFSGGAVLQRAARQAIWCVIPLVIAVVGVRTAFAPPGSSTVSLLPMLMVGVAAALTLVVAARKLQGRSLPVDKGLNRAFSAIPGICILGIIFLMPLTGHVIVGQEDGVLVTASYRPLDGKTSAADFLLGMYPTNNPLLCLVAVASLVFAPIISSRFRTPFFLALFSFLPVTAFLAFGHIHAGLHVLPDFNLWDMSRNTVQWWVGALAAVFAVLGTTALLRLLGRSEAWAAPATAAIFAVGLFQHYPHHAWFLSQRPTVTSSGGFADPPTAFAMDFIWREGRNKSVYVSKESPFAANFYSYQMFGAKSVVHFNGKLVGSEAEQVFLANTADLATILKSAHSRRDSGLVKTIGPDAYIVALRGDGQGALDTQNVPSIFANASGVFGVETSGEVTFRWASKDVNITLARPLDGSDTICLTLKFVNPWADPDLLINIWSDSENRAVRVPETATFSDPAVVKICSKTNADGQTTLKVSANKEARQFPNDSRSVSFGLIWPLE